MEQVAHGIDENRLRFFPGERQTECFLMGSEGEAVAVVFLAHGLEAVGHSLCVAVFAAGADFCAAGDRVPGGFGPFDFALYGHDLL